MVDEDTESDELKHFIQSGVWSKNALNAALVNALTDFSDRTCYFTIGFSSSLGGVGGLGMLTPVARLPTELVGKTCFSPVIFVVGVFSFDAFVNSSFGGVGGLGMFTPVARGFSLGPGNAFSFAFRLTDFASDLMTAAFLASVAAAVAVWGVDTTASVAGAAEVTVTMNSEKPAAPNEKSAPARERYFDVFISVSLF
jgi:hypothetical protein